MKLRLLVPAISALLCVGQAQAQTFEPGLLVRSNGDTLRGEIENDLWEEPPTFIRFRSGPSVQSELLKPQQLRGFMLTGSRYFRYEALPIDHAAESRLDYLPKGLHPNVQTDSVLAEVLLDGPCSLLRVYKFSTTHYLVERPGQPVLDLCDRRYLSQAPNGKWVVREGNNYRAQLELYFGDCPAASSRALTIPFTPEALSEIVQAYNQDCAPAPRLARSWLPLAAPKRAVLFQGGVLAGTNYRHVYEDATGSAPAGCVDCRLHPFAGLYGEILQPSRVLSFYGELTLSDLQGRGLTLVDVTKTTYVVNGSSVDVYTNVYAPFHSHAWVGIARLGVRFYFPLPHDQQYFLGASILAAQPFLATQTSGPPAQLSDAEYPGGSVIPNIIVGWRRLRTSVQFDVLFAGSNNYDLRLGVGYNLSRNPNATALHPTTR